jgi:pyrroloquinoline quinone biosynthesis protein D
MILSEQSRPALARHVVLKRDEMRSRWVILAPERVLVPDDTAAEIVGLADGKASVAEIVDRLAVKYAAPREEIAGDVIEMLQDLADQGYLT